LYSPAILHTHTRQQEKANKRIGNDESGKEGEENRERERLCFLGFVCKRHIRLHALVEDGWMEFRYIPLIDTEVGIEAILSVGGP
jgi:hypothetical protein